MNNIKFYRGLEANLPQDKNSDNLYVTTDSGKIFFGNNIVGERLHKINIGLGTDSEGFSNANILVNNRDFAIGSENIVGSRGYYIHDIDTTNKILILTEYIEHRWDYTNISGYIPDNTKLLQTCKFEVGDELSIVNLYHYDRCCKVTDVSYNAQYQAIAVTVDKLPFSSLIVDDSPWSADYTVCCYDKPDIGIDVGFDCNLAVGWGNRVAANTSTAIGLWNKSYGDYAFTAGRNCEAHYAAVGMGMFCKANERYTVCMGDHSETFGRYSVVMGSRSTNDTSQHVIVLGQENTSSSSHTSVTLGHKNIVSNAPYSYVVGYKNNVLSDNVCVIGHENIVNESDTDYATIVGRKNTITSAPAAFVGGYQNTLTSGYCNLIQGQKLISSTNHQTVLGRWNKQTNDLFVLGYGSSDSDRKNVLTVSKTGDTVIAGKLKVAGELEVTGGITNSTSNVLCNDISASDGNFSNNVNVENSITSTNGNISFITANSIESITGSVQTLHSSTVQAVDISVDNINAEMDISCSGSISSLGNIASGSSLVAQTIQLSSGLTIEDNFTQVEAKTYTVLTDVLVHVSLWMLDDSNAREDTVTTSINVSEPRVYRSDNTVYVQYYDYNGKYGSSQVYGDAYIVIDYQGPSKIQYGLQWTDGEFEGQTWSNLTSEDFNDALRFSSNVEIKETSERSGDLQTNINAEDILKYLRQYDLSNYAASLSDGLYVFIQEGYDAGSTVTNTEMFYVANSDNGHFCYSSKLKIYDTSSPVFTVDGDSFWLHGDVDNYGQGSTSKLIKLI